jgi:hypothetical protein
LKKRQADLRGGRDGARANQHLALPFAPEALVVAQRGRYRVRQGTLAPFRPQVQVDAKAEAVLARRLELVLEPLDHARRELILCQVVRGPIGRVQKEQIDVRGEVELAAAQLPECEDRRGLGLDLFGGAGERGDQAAVGQARQLAGALREGAPEQVARGDAQQPLVFGDADRGPVRCDRLVARRRRRLALQLLRPGRVSQQESAEEVARPEHERQRRTGGESEAAPRRLAITGRQLLQALRSGAGPGRRQQRGDPEIAGRPQVGVLGRAAQRGVGLRRIGLPEPGQQLRHGIARVDPADHLARERLHDA